MAVKPALIYCCPTRDKGDEHVNYAYRFVASMESFQPKHPYDLFVVSNGGRPSAEIEVLFCALPGFYGFIEHDDEGWDIGGFQSACRQISSEVVVMFGGNAYFKRSGWLSRMMDVYAKTGPHLYGAFACTVGHPHIRTTGFWMPRELFNRYPKQIRTHEERYDFEHRDGCLTEWVQRMGHHTIMVTWSGQYTQQYWRQVPNAYGQGDHSECLIADKVSDMIAPVKV